MTRRSDVYDSSDSKRDDSSTTDSVCIRGDGDFLKFKAVARLTLGRFAENKITHLSARCANVAPRIGLT